VDKSYPPNFDYFSSKHCKNTQNVIKLNQRAFNMNVQTTIRRIIVINIIRENWDEILEIMKKEHDISPVAFNTWVKPLTVYSVNGHTITVLINDGLAQMSSYIKKKFEQPLKVTISEYFNEVYDVNLTTSEELDKLNAAPVIQPEKKPAVVNTTTNKTLNPNYTFDTFVVGKNNELAHATALAVASEPGDYGNPLFIYGGVGLGKTHLMHSIAHYMLSYNPEAKIIYTTTETFSSELISAIKNKTQEAFKNKYRNIDMLLIDDIQFIAGKDSTMEEFFHTFNTLYENKKQIVISSDKPPKDIVGVEDRLISRFKVGLTVDVQPPDYETRVAILVKRAELENINIEEEALHYVADHISSNIRELEGALRQIHNFSRLKRASLIDVDLAKEALKDIIAPDEARPITPELIIETVTEHYNYKVTAADIMGKNRSRDIAYPRQICMYLCEKYTGLSLAAIGSALGNKDHTTVLHGTKKIKSELEKDEQLRNTIDIITKKLNPPK
jgi:chromosomal replication initiator protein